MRNALLVGLLIIWTGRAAASSTDPVAALAALETRSQALGAKFPSVDSQELAALGQEWSALDQDWRSRTAEPGYGDAETRLQKIHESLGALSAKIAARPRSAALPTGADRGGFVNSAQKLNPNNAGDLNRFYENGAARTGGTSGGAVIASQGGARPPPPNPAIPAAGQSASRSLDTHDVPTPAVPAVPAVPAGTTASFLSGPQSGRWNLQPVVKNSFSAALVPIPLFGSLAAPQKPADRSYIRMETGSGDKKAVVEYNLIGHAGYDAKKGDIGPASYAVNHDGNQFPLEIRHLQGDRMVLDQIINKDGSSLYPTGVPGVLGYYKKGSQPGAERRGGSTYYSVPDAIIIDAAAIQAAGDPHKRDALIDAAALEAARQSFPNYDKNDPDLRLQSDPTASFLKDLFVHAPAGAKLSILVKPSGDISVEENSGGIAHRFAGRFELDAMRMDAPSSIHKADLGLTISVPGPDGKPVKTVQYRGAGQRNQYSSDVRVDDPWYSWLTGRSVAEVATARRFDRDPDGNWRSSGQTAVKGVKVTYSDGGAPQFFGEASKRLGAGLEGYIGAGAAGALYVDSYMTGGAAVRALGGDVAASRKDLAERFHENIDHNALKYAYAPEKEQYGSNNILHVDQELADRGHAVAGAVLGGLLDGAQTIPGMAAMGPIFEGLGSLGAIGELPGKFMLAQSGVSLGEAGLDLYHNRNDLSSAQGLSTVREFSSQFLFAATTLATVSPKGVIESWKGRAELGSASSELSLAGKTAEPRVEIKTSEVAEKPAGPAAAKPPAQVVGKWSADSKTGTEVETAFRDRTVKFDVIHSRMGVYAGKSVSEITMPGGRTAFMIESTQGSDPLTGTASRRMLREANLDAKGIVHTQQLWHGTVDGVDVLVTERLPDFHPVKSRMADTGAGKIEEVRAAFEKLRRAGYAPPDIGEAFLMDSNGNIVVGQVNDLISASENPEGFKEAVKNAQRFLIETPLIEGGVSAHEDVDLLKRQARLLDDLHNGRAPADGEYYKLLIKYNHAEPGDASGPERVKQFLENRMAHKVAELNKGLAARPEDERRVLENRLKAAKIPEHLNSPPPNKVLFAAGSDEIMAKLRQEYNVLKRRNGWPGDFEEPFKPHTNVKVSIYEADTIVARAYTEGKSNPKGFFVMTESQAMKFDEQGRFVRWKTAEEIHKDMVMPGDPPQSLALLRVRKGTVVYHGEGNDGVLGHAAAAEGVKMPDQDYLRNYANDLEIIQTIKLMRAQ